MGIKMYEALLNTMGVPGSSQIASSTTFLNGGNVGRFSRAEERLQCLHALGPCASDLDLLGLALFGDLDSRRS